MQDIILHGKAEGLVINREGLLTPQWEVVMESRLTTILKNVKSPFQLIGRAHPIFDYLALLNSMEAKVDFDRQWELENRN